MNVSVKKITSEDKSDAFCVRRRVFVEEQRVPMELEIDEYEDEATHFVAYIDGEPVGTARLRWKDHLTVKAERVAVLKPYRGNGVGKLLMQALEEEARRKNATSIQLHAQIQAQQFYERLGYKAYGDLFFDADIEHIAMKKTFY
ncbi:GNAT family N-acetyltransferase [Novibacillus thermophilus]|uniref:N-acetyltransferase domain-containing protein n=1 Tax=Novibacillus thermophilus TaxID=1471761 RepID=A0A1U9K8M3_9BACL|nr:GNAT family N-acetyltransferase [Novibacillus thermophilus]AQS56384.1 hypothetical protein B0W44_12040 [Novibacillus thermophilus]